MAVANSAKPTGTNSDFEAIRTALDRGKSLSTLLDQAGALARAINASGALSHTPAKEEARQRHHEALVLYYMLTDLLDDVCPRAAHNAFDEGDLALDSITEGRA